MNQNTALKILRILKQAHGRSFHRHEDPFFVLIFTVLSARSRDAQTYKAAAALFKTFPTMEAIAQARTADIEKTIGFVGLYRQKALRVKEISKLLLREHRGVVPKDMEELLQLPGVGRKTASCVLIYAHHLPAIAVDVHVHRISNRIGLVKTKTAGQTESELMKLLPKKKWLDVNETFVKHGQTICLPRIPRCGTCPITKYCDYYKAVASKSTQ